MIRLLLGVVTERVHFWPWLAPQLAAQRAPDAEVTVVTVTPEDVPEPPAWLAHDPDATHHVLRLPRDTPLFQRRNAVLAWGRERLSDGWLCWADDDDLISPRHLSTIAARVALEQARDPWAVGTNVVTVTDVRDSHYERLGRCPTVVTELPPWFCASAQSAFSLARTRDVDFPPQHRGSDTGWITRLRGELGPPAIALPRVQTYVALAHGHNRCNDPRWPASVVPTPLERLEGVHTHLAEHQLAARFPSWA